MWSSSERPTGHNIELGIAETNPVGLSVSSGRPGAGGVNRCPIGVMYDPFAWRAALELWTFGPSSAGQSILVGTPPE